MKDDVGRVGLPGRRSGHRPCSGCLRVLTIQSFTQGSQHTALNPSSLSFCQFFSQLKLILSVSSLRSTHTSLDIPGVSSLMGSRVSMPLDLSRNLKKLFNDPPGRSPAPDPPTPSPATAP